MASSLLPPPASPQATPSAFPWRPWQFVTEKVVSAITGRSCKSLQHDRHLNIGIPFKRLNTTSVRYLVADVLAWIERQPSGGEGATTSSSTKTKRGPGRPKKAVV
jgi:hypothetical protein